MDRKNGISNELNEYNAMIAMNPMNLFSFLFSFFEMSLLSIKVYKGTIKQEFNYFNYNYLGLSQSGSI